MYTMEHDLVTNKNEITMLQGRTAKVANIVLSEATQTRSQALHFSFFCSNRFQIFTSKYITWNKHKTRTGKRDHCDVS